MIFVLYAMSTYRHKIVQTLIVDIEPDEKVKPAMNEINAGNPNLCLLWLHLACCHILSFCFDWNILILSNSVVLILMYNSTAGMRLYA